MKELMISQKIEPGYADHYRKVLGRKAWHSGPFWLWNCVVENKAKRCKEASIDEHDCMKWLSSNKANSDVYVCFGSIANFASSRLLEIVTSCRFWVAMHSSMGTTNIDS